MISLAQYATDEVLIRLIAKERGKYADKTHKHANRENTDDPLYVSLKDMTPPHKAWRHPGNRKMPQKAEHGLAAWTAGQKRATSRVLAAIERARHVRETGGYPDGEPPWMTRLDVFLASIHRILDGEEILIMEKPEVKALPKEEDPQKGLYVFRPICRYSELKTKILLAVTYSYFLRNADRYFGNHMLFMRAARPVGRDGNGKTRWAVPSYTDAIDQISAYRKQHDRQPIYVGECDIQKFYDIFNHDDVLSCFDELFRDICEKEGCDISIFEPVRRIVSSYLASYNFPDSVLQKNDDSAFWEKEIRKRRKPGKPEPLCYFKWVKDEEFLSSGCYTEEELAAAKTSGKLGVPQGGALSGLIVNVVMRSIDKQLLSQQDPDRLFIRYCDDILLMHTDKVRCADYLKQYYEQLLAHKLLAHPFMPVSALKTRERNRAAFWKQKSKNVYLWGPGEGEASDWVAFLGYEMRRTGEIRIRKDKIEREFRRISHAYHTVIHARAENRTAEHLLERFGKVPPHILDYQKATVSRYTIAQGRRLDKYLYRKAKRAASSLKLEDPKSIARQCLTYEKTIKERR